MVTMYCNAGEEVHVIARAPNWDENLRVLVESVDDGRRWWVHMNALKVGDEGVRQRKMIEQAPVWKPRVGG